MKELWMDWNCHLYCMVKVFLSVFQTGKCCDEGKSFLSEFPETATALAYQNVIKGNRSYSTSYNLSLIHI